MTSDQLVIDRVVRLQATLIKFLTAFIEVGIDRTLQRASSIASDVLVWWTRLAIGSPVTHHAGPNFDSAFSVYRRKRCTGPPPGFCCSVTLLTLLPASKVHDPRCSTAVIAGCSSRYSQSAASDTPRQRLFETLHTSSTPSDHQHTPKSTSGAQQLQ
jgi:hypothetical protein